MNKDSITQKLRNRAKELDLNYNLVLSKFFFDEFLKLISISVHRENFMLKGGMLLTYTLGVQNRSTQDIDFLVKGFPIKTIELKRILKEILGNTNKKDIWFELNDTVEEIKEEDKYGGLRFHVIGHLANIRIPFIIDIATGDPIYPLPKLERYSTILGDNIELNMYPLETVLSEKLQTILTRAENNSRSKDFYDIYMIFKLKNNKIDVNNLKQAIWETAKNRNSTEEILESKEILEDIKNDEYLNKQWNIYKKENKYVDNIQFSEILKLLNKIADIVQE